MAKTLASPDPPKPAEAWSNPVASYPRDYPWMEIHPGQVAERIFELSELTRVRRSLSIFNARNRRPLTIRQERGGTPETPRPHFRVGWDPSHIFELNGPVRTAPHRQRNRPAAKPKKNSGSKSAQEE